MINSYINTENGTPCFVIHDALTPEHCDDLIKLYEPLVRQGSHQMTKDSGESVLTTNKSIRNSDVAWTDNKDLDNWLFDLLRVANHNTGWRYDITSHEQHQFTRYQPEGHYSWHMDGSGDHICSRDPVFGMPKNLKEVANPACAGTVRKISASVLLNDDFSGGEFDAKWLSEGQPITKEIKPKRGDAIFFPSSMQHRVRPLRTGIRYSLVSWFAGPPFK